MTPSVCVQPVFRAEDIDEVLLYIYRNRRLIRDRSPGRSPPLSHSSWALLGMQRWDDPWRHSGAESNRHRPLTSLAPYRRASGCGQYWNFCLFCFCLLLTCWFKFSVDQCGPVWTMLKLLPFFCFCLFTGLFKFSVRLSVCLLSA